MYNKRILDEYRKNIQAEEERQVNVLCKKLLKLCYFKRKKNTIIFEYNRNNDLFVYSIEYNQSEDEYSLNYFSYEAKKAWDGYFGNVAESSNSQESLTIYDQEIIDLYKTAKAAEEILDKNIKKFLSNEENIIKLSADVDGNALIELNISEIQEYFNIRQYDIYSISIIGFKITVTYYDVDKDNLLYLKQKILDIAKLIDLKKYINFVFQYL